MKTKKIFLIAACSLASLLAGCGTKDDTPGTLSPTDELTGANNPSPSTIPATGAKAIISINRANELAFEDAGVTEDELDNLSTHLIEEENRKQYTVTFATAKKTYQYCIAASDGTILSKSINSIPAGSENPEEDTSIPETTTTPTPSTAPISTTAPQTTPTKTPTKPTSTTAPTKAPTSPTSEITQDPGAYTHMTLPTIHLV